MASMYKMGRPDYDKRFVIIPVAVAIIILIALVMYFAVAGNGGKKIGPGTGSEQTSGVEAVKTISEQLFSLTLPQDWEEVSRQNQPQRYIEWQGTETVSKARSIRLYIDTVPPTQGLTRLVPVGAFKDQLSLGVISENCADLVSKVPMTPELAKAAKVTPAKWQGVDFLCDLPHYQKEIIGTGSIGAINSVTLAGPAGGAHKYFFVYNDAGATPDDTVVINILESFRVK